MQIVGALAKVFSVFSRYHQRLAVIWWHHHVPWYYQPKKIQKTKYRIQNGGIATGKHTNIALALLEGVFHLFSAKTWKSYFERYWIIPHIKYMVATSYYTAYCLEQYCGRKATVIHPVISPSFQPSPDTSGREVESTSDGSLCTFDDKSTKIIQGTKTRYEPISS